MKRRVWRTLLVFAVLAFFASVANGQAARPVVSVAAFGAVGDGAAKNTAAFQGAIDRVWALGGGEVRVPAGNYLTGAIALRSNVMLVLEEGAVVRGSSDLADYPVMQVRWEGKWIPGHVGLIYAIDAQNIGIRGPGKIVGNGAVAGRPTAQNPRRRAALIEPMNCRGVTFEGFSTEYQNMWSIHPTYCEDVRAENLTIRSTGGNGDGIDVDSCKRVRIARCDIATGDDCIAIKSGRGMEANVLGRATEDVTIEDCTLADSIFACIGIGSETSGGIRNVTIRRCRVTAARTFAIYIKSRPGRGASIENIDVEDVEARGMGGGFLRFNLLTSGLQDQVPVPGEAGIPAAKKFRFSNIRVIDAPVLVDGTGVHPAKPLEGLVLERISGTCAKGISLVNATDVTVREMSVTGFAGALIGTHHVSGTGLEGAAAIEAPKLPEPVPAATAAYELK